MCGIAGWFVKKGVDWRPTKSILAAMYSSIESRGKDATGYGTLQDNGVLWLSRGPVTATQYITSTLMPNDVPIGRAGLLHTRAATIGDPSVNSNNHPLPYYSEDTNSALLAIHNGSLGNVESVWKKLGMEPTAEVDSAIIPAVLGKFGAVEGLKFLREESSGSAAIAALWGDGRLLLAKDMKPIFLTYMPPGVLLFASEKDILLSLCSESQFGISFGRIWEAPNEWYLLLGAGGDVLATGKDFRLPAFHRSSGFTTSTKGVVVRGDVITTGSKNHESRIGQNGKLKCSLCDGEYWFHHSCSVDANNRITRIMCDDVVQTFLEGARPPSKLRRESLNAASPDWPPKQTSINHKAAIYCLWGGCWKRARLAVEMPESFGFTWAPLCEHHRNKYVKHRNKIIVSADGELARKNLDASR